MRKPLYGRMTRQINKIWRHTRIRSVRLAGFCLSILLPISVALGAPPQSQSALAPSPAGSPPPQRLRETGLYAADSLEIRPDVVPYSPQYPLWSDGATKRRWLYLPPGAAIDASRPEAWEFPNGTRLWKEFGHDRPVETRFIERLADGSWRYATYVWNADASDAVLAAPEGVELSIASAPRGSYSIPAEGDCRACHEGAAVPVLGVSALQLSPDRDPLAPHAEAAVNLADLRTLVARGLVRNLPSSLLANPPRIAASSPTERAALGYLHGNCGHCHNDVGSLASLDMALAQDTFISTGSNRTLGSLVGQVSRFRPHGMDAGAQRIAPGKHDASVLSVRMRSRNPITQMPPLGTQVADADGLALIQRWINDLSHQEHNP